MKHTTKIFVLGLAFAFLWGCEGGVTAPIIPMITITGPEEVPLDGIASFNAVTSDSTDRGYRWSSSNPEVLEHLQYGAFIARGIGWATVQAEGVQSGTMGSFSVQIQDREGEAYVEIRGPSSLELGAEGELSATTYGWPEEGHRWLSSNPALVSVDAQGLIRGLQPGEAWISAQGESSGLMSSWPVQVSEGRLLIMGPDTAVVRDTWSFEDPAQGAAAEPYEWSSSDPERLLLGQDGQGTALASGEVTVQVVGLITGLEGEMALTIAPE